MTVASGARSTHRGARLRFKDRLLVSLAGMIGPALLRLLGATWRIRFVNEGVLDEVHASGRRVIYAFWHCFILGAAYTHRRSGCVVFSSWHRDGEISARVMRALGYLVERGSTTRGSVRGLLRMIARAREGRDLAITPDGPKGPARVAQVGVFFLALKVSASIVPLAVGVGRYRRLSSWDGFYVPYPFARVVVLYGEPINVDPDADLETAAVSLTSELERLSEKAQLLADGGLQCGELP